MSLPERTEFLVVGAGPTGLACALSLHIHGCSDVTVVDAVQQGEDSSRALVIHSATLEALEAVGCAEPLVELGIKETKLRIWDGSRFNTIADFTKLAPYTKYPFVLVLPQFITERVLGEQVQKRGIRVCRPHKVIGLKINEHDTNMTDVTFEDGQIVTTRYVIGADGSKSAVRHAAGIRFEDPQPNSTSQDETPPSTAQMVLADVTFTEPPPREFQNMAFMFSPNNAFLWIPMPDCAYDDTPERVYRVGAGIPTSMGVPPHAPSASYVQDLIDRYGPVANKLPTQRSPQYAVAKVLWSTRYRTNCAIADTFFTRLGWTAAGNQYYFGGVVLLLGDAAHIHSPAGGQGMNLGIRDAIALGSALATHVAYTEPVVSPSEYRELDKPLREWSVHRRARGITVISLTKRLLSFAGVEDKSILYWGIVPVNWAKLRNIALNIVSNLPFVQRALAWRLSGLGNR
ncbi:FAD/NAD(P)-binding domain superfamily protein [Abortiporus biennis]